MESVQSGKVARKGIKVLIGKATGASNVPSNKVKGAGMVSCELPDAEMKEKLFSPFQVSNTLSRMTNDFLLAIHFEALHKAV